jgi:hypothetical protein
MAKQSSKTKRTATQKEQASFVDALRRNRQVVAADKPLTPGATHQEVKVDGKSVVVRRRFSAR